MFIGLHVEADTTTKTEESGSTQTITESEKKDKIVWLCQKQVVVDMFGEVKGKANMEIVKHRPDQDTGKDDEH